jgi:hypothetical protein
LTYAAAVVLVWIGLFLFMKFIVRAERSGRFRTRHKGGLNRQSRRQERAMKKGRRHA